LIILSIQENGEQLTELENLVQLKVGNNSQNLVQLKVA